ncbi:hypothetical protein GGS24DRAFT_462731 [Hypoxylon argillaceum]|nr:hypothetical protein GGS24DRAFT_462731 [Hypoxylon argillaceum]KAI1155794.1 hypothetical protein F4825DRAFT_406570 [Nemania diffusa]
MAGGLTVVASIRFVGAGTGLLLIRQMSPAIYIYLPRYIPGIVHLASPHGLGGYLGRFSSPPILLGLALTLCNPEL